MKEEENPPKNSDVLRFLPFPPKVSLHEEEESKGILCAVRLEWKE